MTISSDNNNGNQNYKILTYISNDNLESNLALEAMIIKYICQR